MTMMPVGQSAPKWDRLLSLAVHEFRTPVTVVAGYIRMLLKDRAGPLTPQQQRLLEEAEKSCARLSGLIAEMSELSNLEAGTLTMNRGSVNVSALLNEAVAMQPPIPDRDVQVTLDVNEHDATVRADPVRLRNAFAAVFTALRREVIDSDRLVVRVRREEDAERSGIRIAVAGADQIDTVEDTDAAPGPFDEWRGGCGLSLAIARRIIDSHEGRIWAPLPEAKTGAIITLPVE
jgi:signal transduction histidine kinase